MKNLLIISFLLIFGLNGFGQTEFIEITTHEELDSIVKVEGLNEAILLFKLHKEPWKKYILSSNNSDELGKMQGFWIEYFNDELNLIAYYKDDTLDGKYYVYYENGELKTEVFSKMGVLKWAKYYCINGEAAAYEEMDENLNTTYGIKYWDCENNHKIDSSLEIGTRKYKDK